MRTLVVLAVVGVCSAFPFIQDAPDWYGPVAATVPAGVDGTITPVGDTHEVAAARAAFNNAYQAQLRATVGAAPAVHSYAPTYHHAHAAPQHQPKWTGPVAATVPAGLPGSAPQVADTPEVGQRTRRTRSTDDATLRRGF
ncbi:calcified cuticle protein CP19.0 isoform B [Penaeus vannamei]|uniref:Calcified cuticle protein CP19.0 isoform B n=1 Tax=Penaeus vannamei TaxID=6689 RepID=A0A3R7M5I2_PENVA|nr:calcified cuticle protein CP19.0 isoform B [Penaeus vannamei]